MTIQAGAANLLSIATSGWGTLPNSNVLYTESVEDPRSPEEELRPDGSRVVSTMRVPWDKRRDAIRLDILESSSIVTQNGVQFISRVLPRGYRGFTNSQGNPYLFASEVMRCAGSGMPPRVTDPLGAVALGVIQQNPGFGNPPAWLLANLQILYTDRLYEIQSDNSILQTDILGNGNKVPDEAGLDRYVYITSSGGGSLLPYPFGTFQYVMQAAAPFTPQPATGQPTANLPTDEIRIMWYYVPKLAVGARSVNFRANLPNYWIDKCRGCVNINPFPPGSPNPYPPGTLLFTQMNPTPVRGSLGDRLYNLEFRFSNLNLGGLVDDLNNAYYVGHQHKISRLKTDGAKYVWRQLTVDGADNFPGSGDNAKDNNSILNWRPFEKMFRVPQVGL